MPPVFTHFSISFGRLTPSPQNSALVVQMALKLYFRKGIILMGILPIVRAEAPMNGELRRRQRTVYRGTVTVSWVDSRGEPRFGQMKCLDISASGARIELPQALAARSPVSLRFDRIGFSCSGSVRHCVRYGIKYHIGIEFSTPIPERLLPRQPVMDHEDVAAAPLARG